MKSIYLDPNVFGHMLDKGDWKAHPIGKVLRTWGLDVPGGGALEGEAKGSAGGG